LLDGSHTPLPPPEQLDLIGKSPKDYPNQNYYFDPKRTTLLLSIFQWLFLKFFSQRQFGLDGSLKKKGKSAAKISIRLHPDAQHRENTADKNRGGFHVQDASGNHLGNITACPDELLDLLPGNEHFADGLAARQLAAPQEPPDGLGAHVEDLGGLFDVIEHGCQSSIIGGSGRYGFNGVYHSFWFRVFMAVIGHAPFSQMQFQKIGR